MTRRVFVTGMGVVSSLGLGRQAFWTALVEGRKLEEILANERHAGESGQNGSPQHPHEHRFGLIVGCMTGDNAIRVNFMR